jgi:hypothetical protein
MGLGMRDVADLYTQHMSEYIHGMRTLITNTWRLETLSKSRSSLVSAGSGRNIMQ